MRALILRLVLHLSLFGTLAVVLAIGCAGGRPASAPAPSNATTPLAMSASLGPGSPLAVDSDRAAKIPIYPEDARWGSPDALVTMVAVLDLQCPFCARVDATLEALREKYGPTKLRIVVKHYPLPFHPFATRAALAAISVRAAAGDDSLFRFVRTVFANQSQLSDASIAEWAASATGGKKPPPDSMRPEQQLGRDMDLVQRLGNNGTPTFYVDGAVLPGAQPLDQFTTLIDAELRAIEEAKKAGQPWDYASRVAANFVEPVQKTETPAQADDPDAGRIWKIPVGNSPVLGPADALVTIVEFGDYQCPFCKRVQGTLTELRRRYGSDLRFVFKHNPLPFHDRARPAARLAVEAYRQGGAPTFWTVNESLFGAPVDKLDDAALVALAKALGLDTTKAKRAIETTLRDPEIQVDQDLAADFGANGTPAFFINGRRFVGAQPYENFVAVIDDALAVAKEMVDKGVPRSRVYQTIFDAADAPPPPPTADVGPPPANAPSLGPANATVVIQEFSDFQCPFCKRVLPTLEALQKEFPKDVRIVWRNLPLDFHRHAREAANAALEARALRGEAAFWKMHDAIFDHQSELSADQLRRLAESLGLDGSAVAAAIRTGRHDALIDEDRAAASQAGINGTPGFVINGYLLSGAQPLGAFRRVVRRALDDARRPPLGPPPAAAAAPRQ